MSLEECFEFRLKEVGVALDLVDRGDNFALIEDALRLGNVEVGRANGVILPALYAASIWR